MATLEIARAGGGDRDGGAPLRAAELAGSLGIPANYLSKILHQLARAEVLSSTRGPSGGFRLSEAPERVNLETVLAPFMPAIDDTPCLLGRPECRDDDPCAAHEQWREVSERLRRFLNETTLADLLRRK